MPDVARVNDFYQRVVEATPGGETLDVCLQCGTCGGSCPSGADMDASPRRLFAMMRAGLKDDVLASNTPWYCVSCYYCTVRCPQEIPITDLMYTLKRMSIEEGYYHQDSHVDFSESFIGYVERFGRSFEFGLATRYHLAHHPLTMLRKTGLGFELIQKGRLQPNPEKINDMGQLTAILDEAKRIAARQEV